jgi:hypothetical protein
MSKRMKKDDTRSRSSDAAACDIIDRSASDPFLWAQLLNRPGVADFVRKSLKAKVSQDENFAENVARLRMPQVLLQSTITQRRMEGPFKLPSEAFTKVMSFLNFQGKVVECQRVSLGFHEAMQDRSAWEPLFLDKLECKAFMVKAKQIDPCCIVGKVKKFFPAGLFAVTTLNVVLMDPQPLQLQQTQSDTEDDAPRPMLVSDPFSDICIRIHQHFTSVSNVTITNIGETPIDYRFVCLRCNYLAEFGFVDVSHCGSTHRYQLRARRANHPRVVNQLEMVRENRSRVPAGHPVDTNTTINEQEALYLTENLSAFKNGDRFHLIHNVHCCEDSHTVRKNYKTVIVALF